MLTFLPAAATIGIAVLSLTLVPSADKRAFPAVEPVFIGGAEEKYSAQLSVSPEIMRQLEPLEVETHIVKKGETLEKIAALYGTDVDTLRGINKLDYPSVSPGRKLIVMNKRGYLYRAKRGETLEFISRRFGVGEEVIREVNSIGPMAEPAPGQAIYLPGVKMKFSRYVAPIRGLITSRFGMRYHPILGTRRFHEGIDLRQKRGAPIFSAREGRVTFAGRHGGYGKMVEIRHADGFVSRYGHMSKILVRAGQKVRQGQVVGRVGSTGFSTGPHLHFEIRRYGKAINPMRYLRGVL